MGRNDGASSRTNREMNPSIPNERKNKKSSILGAGLEPAAGRIIDVNLNRLTEALKVIEDIVRLGLESKSLLRRVRSLRKKVGEELIFLRREVIGFRASEMDLGRSDRFDRLKRHSIEDILLANFKRSEEAARVLEEMFKMVAKKEQRRSGRGLKGWSGWFKELRFQLYDLERAAVAWGRKKRS